MEFMWGHFEHCCLNTSSIMSLSITHLLTFLLSCHLRLYNVDALWNLCYFTITQPDLHKKSFLKNFLLLLFTLGLSPYSIFLRPSLVFFLIMWLAMFNMYHYFTCSTNGMSQMRISGQQEHYHQKIINHFMYFGNAFNTHCAINWSIFIMFLLHSQALLRTNYIPLFKLLRNLLSVIS